MRKILLWLGVLLYISGVGTILSNVVRHYIGLDSKFDVGHLTGGQLSSARLWHLGLGIALLGVGFLMLWRRIAR
jgi:hypothetical protein